MYRKWQTFLIQIKSPCQSVEHCHKPQYCKSIKKLFWILNYVFIKMWQNCISFTLQKWYIFNKIKQTVYLIICQQWENSLPYLENTNSYVSDWIAFLCLVIFSNISLFVSHSPPSTKHPHDLSSQEERRELPAYSLNPINFISILMMVLLYTFMPINTSRLS